jgi:hypothetical protein
MSDGLRICAGRDLASTDQDERRAHGRAAHRDGHSGLHRLGGGRGARLAFSTAHDAITAAVEAQRALASHDFGDGIELEVRMGIHTGEPAVTGEGLRGR